MLFLAFVALMIAISVYVMVWAVLGIRKKRLVVSADGKHALEGRGAIVFAAVSIALAVTFVGLLIWFTSCSV